MKALPAKATIFADMVIGACAKRDQQTGGMKIMLGSSQERCAGGWGKRLKQGLQGVVIETCAKHDQRTGGDEDNARELTREICR